MATIEVGERNLQEKSTMLSRRIAIHVIVPPTPKTAMPFTAKERFHLRVNTIRAFKTYT